MSEENIGGEEGIIEERRKKLDLLREKNQAYLNDFYKDHYAANLINDYASLNKEELDDKTRYIAFHKFDSLSKINQ